MPACGHEPPKPECRLCQLGGRTPSVGRRLANFAGSLARHVAHGLPTVGEPEKQRRLAICGGCDRHQDGKCLECGCALKVKASWELERCPLGKWEPTGVGVAVGCFGQPDLARLQCRSIRRTCGSNTPVLLCDDGSPEADRLAAVAAEEHAEFAPNPRRLGHYAGDLSVFRKAVAWGVRMGFRHVVKLSQRMLFTEPGWLSEALGHLDGTVNVAVGQQCIDSGFNLFWRTEAMILDVAAWSAPAVLAQLEADVLTNPTELRVNHAVAVVLGGKVSEWKRLNRNRYHKSPATLWHCTDHPSLYRELAAGLGVTLPPDFSTDGHQGRPGYLKG